MTDPTRVNARDRILSAAADVARESGPGSLSLDAVAHHAGISKGGLLYHFPTKASLMRALVEAHITRFEQALEAARNQVGGTLAAYLKLSDCEGHALRGSHAWIFTAVAEDPDFLEPIRQAKIRLYDRLMAETEDPTKTLVVFLALEGLKSLTLFDFTLLSPEIHTRAIDALAAMIDGEPQESAPGPT